MTEAISSEVEFERCVGWIQTARFDECLSLIRMSEALSSQVEFERCVGWIQIARFLMNACLGFELPVANTNR